MRQRNVSGYTVTVPLIPAEIGPGETIEYPALLAGFSEAEPPDESPSPEEPAPSAGSSASQPSKKAAEPAPVEKEADR